MRWISCLIAAITMGVALNAASDQPKPTLISQKGKVFAPTDLTVKRGESVLFRNDDPVTHNVFSRTEGSQFNLKMQKPGQEDIVVLDEPGPVTVRCAIHPSMKLTIHVEEE